MLEQGIKTFSLMTTIQDTQSHLIAINGHDVCHLQKQREEDHDVCYNP